MAQAAVCFLPDCADKLLEFKGDANISTKYCRDEGYVYYSDGRCPEYYATEVCPYDSHYLKCDATKWCTDNGYETKPENVLMVWSYTNNAKPIMKKPAWKKMKIMLANVLMVGYQTKMSCVHIRNYTVSAVICARIIPMKKMKYRKVM